MAENGVKGRSHRTGVNLMLILATECRRLLIVGGRITVPLPAGYPPHAEQAR